MDCLDNFIGVRGCGDTTSKSGLFIDDLPGVGVPQANQITADTPNGEAFLRQKINFAVKEFAQMILAELEKKEPQCALNCVFTDVPRETSIETVGIRFERSLTALTKIRIRNIMVRSVIDGPMTIIITDGTNPITIDVEITAREQLVEVDYTALNNRVDITAINGLSLLALDCGSGVGCRTCDPSVDFRIKGLVDGVEGNTAYGFIPDICLECDLDRAMCTILGQMKTGAQYYAGASILEEYLISDRLTFLVLHSEEWAAQKITEWNAKAQHFYINNLNSLGRYFQRLDPNCFICSGNHHGYIKP